MSKLKTLNGVNTYDSLRLKIPTRVFDKINTSKFQNNLSITADTQELIETPSVDTLYLQQEHKGNGLNVFTIIPHLEEVELQISSKILRDEYHKGISLDTAERVVHEIKDRGICEDIDIHEMMMKGKVLRLDNTFNIPVTEEKQDYYDSLTLMSSQSRRGRIDIFDEKGTTTGVRIGKGTNFLQQITIYDKMEESRVLTKSKYPSLRYETAVEKEYGMTYNDFHNYFRDKLRLELRVTKKEQLRRFYSTKHKGEVYLEEILTSKHNIIEYQWKQFISSKHTKLLIDFLDLQYNNQISYNMNSYNDYQQFVSLEPFIKQFKGNEPEVVDMIQKLFYTDKTTGKKKHISPTVKESITKWCGKYREGELMKKNGKLFPKELSKLYKEVEDKIQNL